MKINLKKLNLKSKKPEKPQGQSQKQETPKVSKSPNLLQNVLAVKAVEQQQFKISKSAFMLIVLIQILFVALSLYNSRMVRQIIVLQESIRLHETNVLGQRQSEIKIRDIIERINILREVQTNRALFNPRVKTFISKMPKNVVLKQSYLQQESMTLTVETNTPLEVSLLISKYISENFAKEISIQTATLDRTNNNYITTMEVIFL
jgi:hypothetical protein